MAVCAAETSVKGLPPKVGASPALDTRDRVGLKLDRLHRAAEIKRRVWFTARALSCLACKASEAGTTTSKPPSGKPTLVVLSHGHP